MLLLVLFDIKGTYNNIAKAPELQKLKEYRILEILVQAKLVLV